MQELKLYDSYLYSFIENYFEELIKTDPNFEWFDGNLLPDTDTILCGTSYILIIGSVTYTFILTGYSQGNGGIYKLVFME